MKKEIADLWIEDLLAYPKRQGRGRLRPTRDTYCCLGRLCQLAVKAKVILPAERTAHGYHYGRDSTGLPDSVRDWAGMKSSVGRLLGSEESLAQMNDLETSSFATIAEVIKRNWRDL